MAIGIDKVGSIGDQTVFNCPDCGGGLWMIKTDQIAHYRCHVGHSYSERDLLIRQSEQIESTIWVALRLMEERANLLRKLQQRNAERGFNRIAAETAEKIHQLEFHITRLKDLLVQTQKYHE